MQKKDIIETEVLVIGSSPICLIESLYLAYLGKKVVIVEKNNYLGGSWQTINIGKLTNLDAGCHIITRKEKAYQFLIDFLGVDMQKLVPPPFRVVDHKQYGYESASLQFSLLRHKVKNLLKSTSKYIKNQPDSNHFSSFEELKAEIFDIYNIGKSSIRRSIIPPKSYLYPRNGGNEIISNLKESLEEKNVNFFLETKIKSIEINEKNKTGVAHSNNTNTVFKFKQLIITSGSEIKTIHSDSKTINLPKEERTFNHICLVIEDTSGEKISYGHFWGHHTLERINEYTHIANYPREDCRIFMILLNAKSQEKELVTVKNELFGILKKFSIIGKNAKLVDAHLIKHKVPFRSKKLIQEIETQFSPIIRPLYSTNLAISIEMNMERWMKQLPKFNHPFNIKSIV